MTIQITYTNARARLAKLLDLVTQDREIVIIQRRGGEDVAMISAEELSSILETAYLLRSPQNAEQLLSAFARGLKNHPAPRTVDELRHLDRFKVLLLDDIGYVQQSRDEMELLFTLLAERSECRRTVITSNLVFSQWDQILKDPMTKAAAIDRVVHHSIIVEFGKEMSSHRTNHAASRQQEAR